MKILLVDSDEMYRDFLQSILSYFGPESTLEVAKNGVDGLRRTDEMEPDIILVDLPMPYIDGLDMVRELKERRKTADIPVFYLRAGDRGERGQRLAEMADISLPKPFLPKELRYMWAKMASFLMAVI